MESNLINLIWVSNSLQEVNDSDLSNLCSIDEYYQWASQFVKGEPKETHVYSVIELKERGYIGLYIEEALYSEKLLIIKD